MTFIPESKLPQTGTTIFAVMSQLAAQHQAINLSQGFPDFQPPIELQQQISRAVSLGKNQYAPMQGIDALRNALSMKILSFYQVQIDKETEITITHGATEALYSGITSLIHPGDEAILLDPSYDSYQPVIELNGGKPVRVPLNAKDFSIDWQKLKDAITDKTRLIILNFPHNPSGRILTLEDMETLYDLIKDRNIFLISDEVYEHIIYDGKPHVSILQHEGLKERAMVIFSFGKTYSATGWKLGYCVAPEALTREFRKIHQFVTYCANTPVQFAIAAFAHQHDYLKQLPLMYQDLRDTFCQLINERTRFKAVPAQSTIFQLVSYDEVSDLDDVEFSRILTEKHKVASIPISVFSETKPDKKYLRFCFAKDKKVLEEAVERLSAVE